MRDFLPAAPGKVLDDPSCNSKRLTALVKMKKGVGKGQGGDAPPGEGKNGGKGKDGKGPGKAGKGGKGARGAAAAGGKKGAGKKGGKPKYNERGFEKPGMTG